MAIRRQEDSVVCGSGTAIVNQITLTGGKDTGLGQLVGQINLRCPIFAPLLKFRWAGMDSRLANRGSSCGATARGRSAHDPRCLGLPLLAAAAATLRAAFGRLSRCLLGSEAEVHWREFLSSLKARAAQLMTSVINF